MKHLLVLMLAVPGVIGCTQDPARSPNDPTMPAATSSSRAVPGAPGVVPPSNDTPTTMSPASPPPAAAAPKPGDPVSPPSANATQSPSSTRARDSQQAPDVPNAMPQPDRL